MIIKLCRSSWQEPTTTTTTTTITMTPASASECVSPALPVIVKMLDGLIEISRLSTHVPLQMQWCLWFAGFSHFVTKTHDSYHLLSSVSQNHLNHFEPAISLLTSISRISWINSTSKTKIDHASKVCSVSPSIQFIPSGDHLC